MRHTSVLITAMPALLLCACAPEQAGPSATEHPAPAGMLGMPSPAALAGRSGSNSLGFIAGSDSFTAANVSGSGDSTRFFPHPAMLDGLNSCAWCIFRAPTDDEGALYFTAEWPTPPQGGLAWVGVGNLALNRWDWRQLVDPEERVALGDSADYRAPDGSVLLALVLYPGAGDTTLDCFKLEAVPDSGWRFFELRSSEVPSGTNEWPVVEAAIVDGKPAVLFREPVPNSDNEVAWLAVSDTAQGGDIGDWHLYPLGLGGLVRSLAEVDGGFALLSFVTNDISRLIELHYHYGTDAAGSFSDEKVSEYKSQGRAHITAFPSGPGVAFCTADEESTASLVPRYAWSDAPSGGNWALSALSATDEVANGMSDHIAPPLSIGGAPAVGYYNVVGTPAFKVALAGDAFPDETSDWTTAALGAGYDHRLFSLVHNGQPVFISEDFLASPPEEVEFWLYRLTGVNAADPTEWTVTHCDGLGLGVAAPLSFAAVGAELAFLRVAGQSSGLLDGDVETLSLWRAPSPDNSAAAWQAEVLDTDSEAVSSSLISVGGQPAMALALRLEGGFEPESRWICKLVWAVYLP